MGERGAGEKRGGRRVKFSEELPLCAVLCVCEVFTSLGDQMLDMQLAGALLFGYNLALLKSAAV